MQASSGTPPRAAPTCWSLGARGASFMRHLMLGSTAERLVRRSDRPLLVVKQPPHERYRRRLVAVDFSPFVAGEP